MPYDIFISYKRKSLPTANNLYYRLTTRGYSTFFDLEEMRRDNFNIQLLNYIENAKDVFVILEEGSLDGCKKENWESEDWFCHEIAFALEKKKNIIPILLGDYKMPSEDFFPDKLKELSLKHSPDFSYSFFEAYLDKLIEKKFITAEAHVQNKATSVFKFYSNENCQVFKEGKMVCSLEGMSDEPYYLPVPRKGDYRFKAVNNTSKETRILNEAIDAIEEKNVEIKWNNRLSNVLKIADSKRGCFIVAIFCVILSLLLFKPIRSCISSIDARDSISDSNCTHIDLDLPSKTLWGDRNLGAKEVSDYGFYYAWGMEEPIVGQSRLQDVPPEFQDAASKHLGNHWKTPTKEQVQELIASCDWTIDSINGRKGYKVSSKKDTSKFIFLPAGGVLLKSGPQRVNTSAYYWTSDSYAKNDSAYDLHFFVGNNYVEKSDRAPKIEPAPKTVGRLIRAVYVHNAVVNE